MLIKSRIGIPEPTTADLEYNRRSWPEYASAVRAAGGEPVKIPLDSSTEAPSVLQGCTGFLLPGSPADVEAAGYGQAREAATAAADPAREQCDRLIVEHAATAGKPVLGICFGLQMVNVLLGGTLVQDLGPIPVNHAAGPSVAVAHSVGVSAESLLAGLLTLSEAPAEGGFRRLPVNSSHHQAIGLLGEGLAVSARSSQDAVIEACEGRIGGAAFLGVQWHPERSANASAASRAIFLWLVSEAMDFGERSGALADAGSL